jgi:hypothetical protein
MPKSEEPERMFIARTHARTQSGRVVCFRSEEHAEPGLVVMSPQGWAYVQADCKGKPRGDGFMQIEQVTVHRSRRTTVLVVSGNGQAHPFSLAWLSIRGSAVEPSGAAAVAV